MKKYIKKHYIPPYVELLSVEEDADMLVVATGTDQSASGSEKDSFGQGAKSSSWFYDEPELGDESETDW